MGMTASTSSGTAGPGDKYDEGTGQFTEGS